MELSAAGGVFLFEGVDDFGHGLLDLFLDVLSNFFDAGNGRAAAVW
jgi:hypothetical protein